MNKYRVTHHSVRPSGGKVECAIGDVIELTDAEASERVGKIKLVVEKKVEAPKAAPKAKAKAKSKPKSED